jgi:hypothetical protein
MIAQHEIFTIFIAQNPAFAAHGFTDQKTLVVGREQCGWVKLYISMFIRRAPAR